MTKYGKANRLKASRGGQQESDEDARWEPPSVEECDPQEPGYHYYCSETSRIYQRLLHQNGRLVDYAVMHEGRLPSGDWTQIVRIDCKHAEVHRHTLIGVETREVIRVIRSQSDVEDTYDESYLEIQQNWQTNERRWQNAR